MTPATTLAAAAVLRDDPALPGRDRLLDDARAAEVFAAILGVQGPLAVTRVARLRVKYRIGESLRAVHRVWAGEASWLVSSRMRPGSAAALYAAALPRARDCGALRGVAIDPAIQTVCWIFPNDRAIDGGDALTADAAAICDAWPGQTMHVDIVGYNPERAVIARVTDAAGVARGYAKLYAPNDLAPARQALDWLARAVTATRSPLRVPRLLACDEARQMLVVDAVAGQHMGALTAADLAPALARLGTALSHLHALPRLAGGALPPHAGFDAAALRYAADVASWARPDLAERAQALAATLERTRPATVAPVPLHGDMNSRNWLVGANDVGLIDFDQAASGAAAIDLCGVLGWLRARTVAGDWTPAREAALAQAFSAGYAAVRPLPGARELQWHLAAALLVERVQRAVSRVRLDQVACLDALVTAAEAALEAADA